jgi:eukaryotic-like serine/threonine-protein kinase
VQTLARVRECNVPPPSRINPQLPAGVDQIVLKALAKDPAARFSTAQEFRLALEEWLIQGRMSASSAHLAEFLKTIYAERLDKENRLGPLLGDAGFTGPAPGATPSRSAPAPDTSQPTLVRPAPVRKTAIVHQRKPDHAAGTADPSTARTWSDPGPFGSNDKMRFSVAAVALAVVAAAIIVLVPGRKPAAPPPAVASSTLLSAPQKAAPRTHIVTISSEPMGAEIYEGSRLIGRSPKVWTDATEGEHELTLSHEGYHEEKGKVPVEKDGEDFNFKLRRIETARRTAPDLGIKAER